MIVHGVNQNPIEFERCRSSLKVTIGVIKGQIGYIMLKANDVITLLATIWQLANGHNYWLLRHHGYKHFHVIIKSLVTSIPKGWYYRSAMLVSTTGGLFSH